MGLADADIADYGLIEYAYHDPSVRLPRSVDLSGNFPSPGNQGPQGSCVGWATAYALKSYHERIEEGWEFSDHTTFSPAWIYNQVKAPGPCGGPDPYDCGARINDALNLIIRNGAATQSTMRYDSSDYRRHPSDAAIEEAARYKGMRKFKVGNAQRHEGSARSS